MYVPDVYVSISLDTNKVSGFDRVWNADRVRT